MIDMTIVLGAACAVAGVSLYLQKRSKRAKEEVFDGDQEFQILLALIKTGKLTFAPKDCVVTYFTETRFILKNDRGETFKVNVRNAGIVFHNGHKILRASAEKYAKELFELFEQQNQPQEKPKSKLEQMLDESLGILTADPDEIVETISAEVLNAKIDSAGEVASGHADVDGTPNIVKTGVKWFDEMYQAVNREPVFETKPKISSERQEQKRFLDEQKRILSEQNKWKNLAAKSTWAEYISEVIKGIESGELVAKRFYWSDETVDVLRVNGGAKVLNFWPEHNREILINTTSEISCRDLPGNDAKNLARYISENLVSNEAEALEQLKARIVK